MKKILIALSLFASLQTNAQEKTGGFISARAMIEFVCQEITPQVTKCVNSINICVEDKLSYRILDLRPTEEKLMDAITKCFIELFE